MPHATDKLSIHEIQQGDTLTPLMVDFKRPDGTRVDVTGKTVSFEMYNADGQNIATGGTTTFEDHPTVADVTVGQHDFSDEEVETPGTYYAYFRLTESGEHETFPVTQGMLRVQVNARR